MVLQLCNLFQFSTASFLEPVIGSAGLELHSSFGHSSQYFFCCEIKSNHAAKIGRYPQIPQRDIGLRRLGLKLLINIFLSLKGCQLNKHFFEQMNLHALFTIASIFIFKYSELAACQAFNFLTRFWWFDGFHGLARLQLRRVYSFLKSR